MGDRPPGDPVVAALQVVRERFLALALALENLKKSGSSDEVEAWRPLLMAPEAQLAGGSGASSTRNAARLSRGSQ